MNGGNQPAPQDPHTPAERIPYERLAFRAMGTDCQVIFHHESRRRAKEFQSFVQNWVADFERKYSRFQPESLISRINAAAGHGWVETDEELESIFQLCHWFHWRTQGIFDPTSLPLARLWDYHAERPVVPSPGEIGKARELIGWEKVERRPGGVFLPRAGMGLDLGGIGKEYAVDRIFEQSRKWGIGSILVDFGRDLRVRGEPPEGGFWKVGLEHPLDPGRCWGGVAVGDRAVATSGGYLRHFEAGGRFYTHILDPRTGYPVDNGCQAVSVIAPTCTEAGILSTTAFILGREQGLPLLDQASHAASCLWSNGERFETRDFKRYRI